MSSLVPNFDRSLPTTCPIDLGTSPEGEALRWGPKAKAALLAASAARRARMARRIAVEVVKLMEAPLAAVVEAIERPSPGMPTTPDEVLAVEEFMAAYRREAGLTSIRNIQRACAQEFGVEVRDILSSRRTAKVVLPRMVAVYLSRHMTGKSMPEIGRRFGGRDHTTALHSIRKIAAMIDADPVFASRVQSIRERIEAER